MLPALHERLVATLLRVRDMDFELIYVDDGSTDGTLDVLRTFQAGDARVRVLALSRNFGHEAATTAGLAHASGDAVALIDADLQDPPEILRQMVERWLEGVDVAYGLRIARDGETAFKRWTASAFYRVLDCFADIPVPRDAGDFRLMDRKVVDAFLSMPEADRFVRGMVAWTGFRQEPVGYRRAPRAAGKTKYPMGKLLRLAGDGLLSLSLAPLRFVLWAGFVVGVLALIAGLCCLVVLLVAGASAPGASLMLAALLGVGGVQLVLLAVVGGYVGRNYREGRRRPLYLVKERLGFPGTR